MSADFKGVIPTFTLNLNEILLVDNEFLFVFFQQVDT